MGEVHVQIAITNPRTGARSEEITALADTGATLSVIPGALLENLGIHKARSVTLVLADGRRTTRDVGDAVVTVNEDSTPCRVVFGESGDAALLGLTVLEQLGLAVDPVQRRLISTDFLLYDASVSGIVYVSPERIAALLPLIPALLDALMTLARRQLIHVGG